jgi:TonB family protein
VLSAFSIPYPVPNSIDPDIKGIAGAINISDALSGKITIITGEDNVAIQAMKAWDESAFWRNPKNYNINSPLLISGLTANRNGAQIELSIDFKTDALEKYWNSKSGSQSGLTVLPPMPFLKPIPLYTKEALDAQIRGILRVQLTVQKDGTPSNIKVLNGLGYGLDESAITIIVDLWRFIPAIRDGAPIDSQLIMDIPFNPEDHRWQ